MKKFIIFIILIIVYNVASSFTLNSTRENADNIIKNIELYKNEIWEYPKSLNNLVPKYYNKIPRHYSSIMTKFIYFYNKKDNSYSITYIYNAPFWKYFYNSKNKKWTNLD